MWKAVKGVNLEREQDKPHEGTQLAQTEARFGLTTLKNPYNSFLLDNIHRFECLSVFKNLIQSCLPLLQVGTTAGSPAPGFVLAVGLINPE